MGILYFGNMRRKKISEITFEGFFSFVKFNAASFHDQSESSAKEKITKEKFCSFLILAKKFDVFNFSAETKSQHISVCKIYNKTFYRNIQNKRF